METEQKLTKTPKIIIGIACILMLIFMKTYYYWLYYTLYSIGYFGLILATFPIALLVCIIFLILKIAKKVKGFFDWILIVGGSLLAIYFTFITLFAAVFFADQITKIAAIQNEAQQPKLIKYHKFFNYLEMYKKENGVYPAKIDKNVVDVQSGELDKYVYKVSADNKKYIIRIYTDGGPIRYYRHKSDYDEKVNNMTYCLNPEATSGTKLYVDRQTYEATQKNKQMGSKIDYSQSDYLDSSLYEDFEPFTIYTHEN